MSEVFVIPQKFAFGTAEADALLLDCGKKLYGVELCYETYGNLASDGQNAILICHALSGDAHVSGRFSPEDTKRGWWDEMVGPGKYIDTNQYYVICSNVLGSCSGSTGPRSEDPHTGKLYNMDFPVITIADMVRAQKRLLDHLGVKNLLAVIGGSMGGMQALEWAVNYPDFARSYIPIATTAQLSPQSIAFNWVGRQAICNDPAWLEGNYDGDTPPEKGLATARMLAHITYLSDESMSMKFGRDLQKSNSYSFNFNYDFAVESYLEYQGHRFVERFDANSYLYITRAMDYFDIASYGNGSLAAAFKEAKGNFLVVSFSSDWLFPSSQSQAIVNALLQNKLPVSYCEIKSAYGHDAFLLEVETLGNMVSHFLRNVKEQWK